MSDIINRWENKPLSQLDLIMRKEWDYLLILDDARYDMFKRHNIIDGKLTKVYSAGWNSPSFMNNVIHKQDFSDTVAIMGNPYLYRYKTNFKKIRHSYLEDWIKDPGTVCPKKLSKQIIIHKDLYPDSRILGWYMQPHAPFIGVDVDEYVIGTNKTFYDKEYKVDRIFKLANSGDLPVKKLKEFFILNLEYVLKVIEEDLLPEIEGKIVITSDHGEFLGEKGLLGHPHTGFQDDPVLRNVPWLEVEV